jgi:glycosyltransferase involved in cell wall biosynthesis
MVKERPIMRLQAVKSGTSPRAVPISETSEPTVRLSIITQYYPPDFAATGQLVDELARNLRLENLDVQVFTGQPGYAFHQGDAPPIERMDNFQLRRSRTGRLFPNRIRGKALNGLLFLIRSIFHLFNPRHRGDVMLITTAPPFLLIIGYIIHLLFKTPYVCLMYDLYPDIAVGLNVISSKHPIARLWDAVNRQIWRRSSGLIVLSANMRDRIIQKCPQVADKVHIIHSWADAKLIRPMPKTENWFAQEHDLVEPFTVVYSGNMGRCHDIKTILEAARALQGEPIRFVFIGSGAKRPIAEVQVAEWGLTNCQFLPYQAKADLPYSLTAGDLSLVSVDRGMEGLVAPSKLYSALAAGRPIAVVCEPHSYLNRLIADARCGQTFENGEPLKLAEFIRDLSHNPDRAAQLGRAGRTYMKAHFTPSQIASEYGNILRQVAQSANPRLIAERSRQSPIAAASSSRSI